MSKQEEIERAIDDLVEQLPMMPGATSKKCTLDVATMRLAIEALRSRSEASANKLTQRNSMGRAVLVQEFLCDRCNEGFWSLGEITDRLAYYEENAIEPRQNIYYRTSDRLPTEEDCDVDGFILVSHNSRSWYFEPLAIAERYEFWSPVPKVEVRP